MQLLYSSMSPFARKVRVVAFELGLADRLALVVAAPYTDEAVRAINPLSKIPVLIPEDGVAIFDSPVICEYLDEAYPPPPLLPGDAVMRARIRACAMVVACDTHPVQNLRVLKRLRGLGLEEPQVQQWGRDTIEQGFEALDTLLKK